MASIRLSLRVPVRLAAMLAVLGLLVTRCAPVGTEHRLPRPGELLFVRAERRADLERAPPGWCAGPALVLAVGPPVPALAEAAGGPDPAAEPFTRALMAAAAAGFGAGDPSARRVAADLLAGWAEAEALTGTVLTGANERYALDRALLPAIVTLWLVREDEAALPIARRRAVTRWLGGLIAARDTDADGRLETSERNNHHYLAASVDMAWGALTGDAERFAAGPAALRLALRDMREDGSLPLETRRGARALWYQRHAIASLVAIAEMAAVQGLDLYAPTSDGRSLHRAIEFLLDGIADPRRVWRYAAVNERPGPEPDWRRQDLGFLAPRGHGRHYMAWAEPYLARFPDRPESRRLRRLLGGPSAAIRPLVDDYSGGNTTCFYARP